MPACPRRVHPSGPAAAAAAALRAGGAGILALALAAATARAEGPATGPAAMPAALAAAALSAPVARFFAPAGIALGGHDAVAYFTEGRPVPGLPSLALRWRGAVWRFATSGNLDTFEGNPTAFAPDLGGYCAFGLSRGLVVPGDPTAFAIVNGRLYLAHDAEVLRLIVADPAAVIEAARRAWPGLRR
ncbi:MAG: YHS domain protein [Rhodobacteraceae bacterium]|nr:YHS domain protein [Paracoccaceae bacterium]